MLPAINEVQLSPLITRPPRWLCSSYPKFVASVLFVYCSWKCGTHMASAPTRTSPRPMLLGSIQSQNCTRCLEPTPILPSVVRQSQLARQPAHSAARSSAFLLGRAVMLRSSKSMMPFEWHFCCFFRAGSQLMWASSVDWRWQHQPASFWGVHVVCLGRPRSPSNLLGRLAACIG